MNGIGESRRFVKERFIPSFQLGEQKRCSRLNSAKTVRVAKQIEVLSFIKKSFKRVDFYFGICYNSLVKIIYPVSCLERCELKYDT